MVGVGYIVGARLVLEVVGTVLVLGVGSITGAWLLLGVGSVVGIW